MTNYGDEPKMLALIASFAKDNPIEGKPVFTEGSWTGVQHKEGIKEKIKNDYSNKKYPEPEKIKGLEKIKEALSQPDSKFEELEFYGKLYGEGTSKWEAKRRIEMSTINLEDKLMPDSEYLVQKKFHLDLTRFDLSDDEYFKIRYGDDYFENPSKYPEKMGLSASGIKASGEDALNHELRDKNIFPQVIRWPDKYGNFQTEDTNSLDGNNWQKNWANESNDAGGFQDLLQIAAIAKMDAGTAAETTEGMANIQIYFKEEKKLLDAFEKFKKDPVQTMYLEGKTDVQKFSLFAESVRKTPYLFMKKYSDEPVNEGFRTRFMDTYRNYPNFRLKDIEKVAETVHDNIYKRTQKLFSDMGYKPDDEIVVFRGSRGKFFEHQNLITRESIKKNKVIKADQYTTRPLTSFSLSPTTAFQFADEAGIVIATKIKIKDIFSHFTQGFGCKGESEVVLKNEGLKNDIKVVWVSDRGYNG
jgi:hypothetical protein